MALPLRDRTTVSGDWFAEIGAAAEEFMTAEAKFYDSKNLLVLTTICRAQNINAPVDSSTTLAWGTQLRYLVQIPLRTAETALLKGYTVRISGGKDPRLASIALQVLTAANSTTAAVRTVQCITPLATVPPVPAP